MKLTNILRKAAFGAVMAAGLLSCLPTEAAATLLTRQMVLAPTVEGAFKPAYSDPKRMDDYLYECTFDKYDYVKGANFMKTNYPAKAGCAAVRNGSMFGHNYDYKFDYCREVVVHVSPAPGRHASVAVCASPQFTPTSPTIIPINGYFKYTPFWTLDGINDAGLACALNLVEADYGHTTGTNPGKEDLHVNMALRYILDNAASVDEAIALLQNRNLYAGEVAEVQFMLADAKETAVVEIINNQLNVKKGETILTNFFVNQAPMNEHARGVERYNILKANYASGNTKEGMVELLDKVSFTKCYNRANATPWYSDFNSLANGIGLSTRSTQHAALLEAETKQFELHERAGQFRHTVHKSVYDLANKKLLVISQENGKRFEFGVEQVNFIPAMDKIGL